MAIHISTTETTKRLQRADNLCNILIKNGKPFGLNPGTPRVPKELKEIARNVKGNNKELGAMLSVRPETVAAIKGSSERDRLQKVMTKARGTALDKLNAALEHISGEKLGEAKLGELSNVARNMSQVARDMAPESEDAGLTVMIFNTPERSKDDYEVIDVTAKKTI